VRISDDEFIKIMKQVGSPREATKLMNISERAIYDRRKSIEKKYGISLPSHSTQQKHLVLPSVIPENRRILKHYIQSGTILIASDAHYWPGEASVAHKAFVKLTNELKPNAVIMNGDFLDGARISKHDALYGAKPPTVKQEIDACRDRLTEIEDASKNSRFFMTYGNHDIRLWKYCYLNAPELSDFVGMDLFSYFPRWHHGWRIDINDSTIVKHRWHNGVHAGWNNAMKSFLKTSQGSAAIVTGHLHRLLVTPFRGEAGVAYGVDSGTLADIDGDQFHYMEANPTIGASGFVCLTFHEGMLLPPELCEVINGVAYFRGKPL
jgi:predicted phosphodiesterase